MTVSGGGSSSGAKRVCGDTSAGTPVDIGAMSRAWKTTEATAGSPGYKYKCKIGAMPNVTRIDVAIDGLVVIVKKNSIAAACITIMGGLNFNQLRWMFSGYSTTQLTNSGWPASTLAKSDSNTNTHLFSELNSRCSAKEIELVGPTSVFGTHTYFLETILTNNANTETFPTAPRYVGTTTDALTINKVRNDTTGTSIGYVSYNAYNKEKTTITAVSLKKTTTGSFIAPTSDTIADGTYPLSRRIYMNVRTSTVAKTKAFIAYGMSAMGTSKVTAKGFSPIPSSERAGMVARLLSH